MTWGVPSRVEALETCSGFLCGEVIGSEGGEARETWSGASAVDARDAHGEYLWVGSNTTETSMGRAEQQRRQAVEGQAYVGDV